MSLSVTSNQASAIAAIDSYLETAFAGGVTSGFLTILQPIQQYTSIDSSIRTTVRSPFSELTSAIMVGLNIPDVFPTGVSGTINLAKLTALGSNGSITVTRGLITAFTNPT